MFGVQTPTQQSPEVFGCLGNVLWMNKKPKDQQTNLHQEPRWVEKSFWDSLTRTTEVVPKSQGKKKIALISGGKITPFLGVKLPQFTHVLLAIYKGPNNSIWIAIASNRPPAVRIHWDLSKFLANFEGPKTIRSFSPPLEDHWWFLGS